MIHFCNNSVVALLHVLSNSFLLSICNCFGGICYKYFQAELEVPIAIWHHMQNWHTQHFNVNMHRLVRNGIACQLGDQFQHLLKYLFECYSSCYRYCWVLIVYSASLISIIAFWEDWACSWWSKNISHLTRTKKKYRRGPEPILYNSYCKIPSHKAFKRATDTQISRTKVRKCEAERCYNYHADRKAFSKIYC